LRLAATNAGVPDEESRWHALGGRAHELDHQVGARKEDFEMVEI
jgi:hypothetical protein